MKITKKKLLKSTVAKVMAAAMVITMIPAPVIVNAEETTAGAEVSGTQTDSSDTSNASATVLPTPDLNGEITLNNNVTLSKKYEMNQDIILDLNGHTIQFDNKDLCIAVGTHTLTIEDSVGGGSIVKCNETSDESSSVAIINVGSNVSNDSNNKGKVILNSGTIKNNVGGGILSTYDSSVIINGGTIDCKYSALDGGNNRMGNANLYVVGGTLNTKEGPCIYKPSMGDLFIGAKAIQEAVQNSKISNGDIINSADKPILNSGIGIRMGNVKISDVEIQTTQTTVDSPADYYNYGGNVFFPDALFVLGGTYTTSGIEGTDSNDLTLTIDGGTFTCDNNKGSAIAVYDFGKVPQNMTIKINNGDFKITSTNAEYSGEHKDDESAKNSSRTAFDILTLKDVIGTSPDENGYGNTSNTVDATISGGTFSKLSANSRVKKSNDCCFSSDDLNANVTVATHKPTKQDYVPASLNSTGHIEYFLCDNCKKCYKSDNSDEELDSNNINLYCLSAKETEGIEVTFSDGTATGSYGMLRDELLTITRKDGYKFTAAPTVNLASDAPIQRTDFKTSDNGSSYTSTITHQSNIASENLKDCEISIVPNVEKIGYEIKLDKSSLKNADATLGSTTLTSDGSTTLTVTPNKGYTFKNDPVVKAEDGKIEKTTVANGVYSYKISGLTKDCTITVSGEAQQSSQEEKPVQHSIKFSNGTVPKISNAKVSLDPSSALVSHSGSVKLIITPDAGYKITETKVEVKDNGKVCKLSATPELGANGIFVYTISDITADVEITSVTAKTETAKLVELGTNTSTNANEANLSETFEGSDSTEENHNNILSAIKSIISNVTKDTVIFTNNATTLSDEQKEKLVEDVKKAVESDTSKIAISLVVTNANVENSVKEVAKNELSKKNTSGNTSTTIGELYPLDISLFAQVIGNNQIKVKLEDTDKGNITIKMEIPKDIPKKSDKAIRKYYVVRFHKDKDGKETRKVIDVTENKDGTLSFTSNKFSTYVLSYVDTIPSTGQNNSVVISGGGTSVTYPSTTSTSTASAAPSTSATPTPSAAPSATASAAPNVTSTAAPNTTIPSTAPSAIPDTSQSEEPSASATPAQAVKVGQRVNAGTVKYKVVSVNSRTVTVIGSKSVKNIVIPANIKIGEKAYKVTAIANNAFKGNKKLAKITIGANIKKIGKNAFYGCTNLKKITIKTTKLTAKKIGKNAFKGINRKAVIKVPKSKIKAYKKIIAARGAVKTVKIR